MTFIAIIIVSALLFSAFLSMRSRLEANHSAKQVDELILQAKREEVERKQAKMDAELRKAQIKLEEKQRKQAQSIRDLRYKMLVYESEHKAIKQRLDNLYELHEIESHKMESAERAGNDNAKATALRKIISIENQIAAAEKKERDYRYKWTEAKQKLA